jgi:hypothetical protein
VKPHRSLRETVATLEQGKIDQQNDHCPTGEHCKGGGRVDFVDILPELKREAFSLILRKTQPVECLYAAVGLP